MSNPKRVLQVLSSTMRAGVEMMVMNLFREVDKDKLMFDFIVHDLGEDDLGEEIKSLGGRIFRIPLLSKVGITEFVKIIENIIIHNGPYAAVHAHTDYQGGFSALAAKKAGVPIRACHAHLDTRGVRSPVFLAKKLLGRAVILRYATQLCACSKYSGMALFGKRQINKGHVKIINNGIDLTGFSEVSTQFRQRLLQDFHVDEKTRLIGNVARLNPVKNQSFVLDMAVEAKKRGLNYRFIFVGNGELLDELMQKRQRLGLDETVFFLGTRDDVPSLLQCFDLFVLSSFAEGLPLTVVEAQAAGTPVLAASCVPKEADMGLGLLHFMRLEDGVGAWTERAGIILDETVRSDAKTRIDAVKDKGFDAKNNVKTIMSLYGIDALE